MKSSKIKKIFLSILTIFALFLAFIYLPIPGLDATTKSIEFSGEVGSGASPEQRAQDHFALIRASTNLDRPFPEMMKRADNPDTPEKIELGRVLYFDPILSGDNDISCAHCHHPDLGFSDNRGLSMGKGGEGIGPARSNGAVLRRGSPTVWNTAYNHRQFWDGRASDLEDQAGNPIQDKNEMAQNPDELVQELSAIPDYVRQFEKTFGGKNGGAVTFRNVTYAIAAFERTLLANNTRFDRYARGEIIALTHEERRGLNVFRSLKTRCFECHNFPTFANPDFKVIGVPDVDSLSPDLGRGEIAGEGYNRAFKVPTLRNIALTAPYMHNGVFSTLSEVIDFYANGGGHGAGMSLPNIDDKIRKFKLTNEEKQNLIAFLHSLTDESAKPEIPKSVPSGLPVITHLPNQSLELAVFKPKPPDKRKLNILRKGNRLVVYPGQRIQDGLDLATKGDTVLVMPGIYHETLTADVSGITLLGVEKDGLRPVLDGQNVMSDGLVGAASEFEINHFDIKNYTANGLMLNGSLNVTFRDLYCENTGLYGIYPVECIGVTIERCEVTKVRDAGIYVGQSKDIVVRECKAYGNVAGIEIENSVNALVENNEAFNNTAGILVFLLPNNPSKVSKNCRVVNNRVYNNNHENFGDPGAIVSLVPPGAGIMLIAADSVEVAQNEIRGNDSFGLAVLSLDIVFSAGSQHDVDPFPDSNMIRENLFSGNGGNPAGVIKELGFSGKELLWDLTGNGNTWYQPGLSSVPRILPKPSWPGIVRKANKRLWQVAAKISE